MGKASQLIVLLSLLVDSQKTNNSLLKFDFKQFCGSAMPRVVTLVGGSPWGFRLVGGSDFHANLAISKVSLAVNLKEK